MTTCRSSANATPTRSGRGVAPRLGWGVVLLVLGALWACSGGQVLLAPATMPSDAELRRASLADLGQRLFEGLRSGSLDQNFANLRELDAIVLPDARLRLERERASWEQRSFVLGPFRSEWSSARFVGFCAQGAREEPPHAGLGLTQAGWVLDRILVVARPDVAGPRSASWLEGDFVYTGQGWRVLSLRRVEPPRRHHSDLELAPCDVEAGLR